MGLAYGAAGMPPAPPPGPWAGLPPDGWPGKLLRVPLSLSILIDSPVRTDLPLSPVGAFFIPLAESNVFFGSLAITFLNILVTFLFKLQLVRPPCIPPHPSDLARITLTLPQLQQLMKAYTLGQPIDRYLKPPGQDFGPFGGDEPLFPDNLSVSLMLSAPFADFDGSPDASFNVPLFEVPGAPGALIIALLIILARFIVEQSGLAKGKMDGGDPQIDTQGLIRYLMTLKGGRK